MLFARKQHIGDRQPFRPEGRHHQRGLIRRDDLVFRALEDDQRTRELLGKMNRRARDIDVPSFRVGSDQIVRVARLELMGVARQRFEVADPVMTRPGPKRIAKGQCAQGRVSSGAAAGNSQPLGIDLAAGDQIVRPVDAVVHIDNPPVAVQALPIGPPITGAAPIVHVQNGKAAARPVLNAKIKRRLRGRGRSAVAFDDQRRAFFLWSNVVSVCGRIEQTVRGPVVFGWKGNGLGR